MPQQLYLGGAGLTDAGASMVLTAHADLLGGSEARACCACSACMAEKVPDWSPLIERDNSFRAVGGDDAKTGAGDTKFVERTWRFT